MRYIHSLDNFLKYINYSEYNSKINFIIKYNNKNPIILGNDFEIIINNIIEDSILENKINDDEFKKNIIEILNKINMNNYIKCIEYIKSINYHKLNMFEILSDEILIKALTDTSSIKKNSISDNISFSDIYGDIIYDIRNLEINNNIFLNIVLKKYEIFFSNIIKCDFNDKNNNDKFLGYINFIGILFNRTIISKKTYIIIMKQILKIVYNLDEDKTKRKLFFNGFVKLINHILIEYDNKKKKKYISVNIEFLNNIISIIQDVQITPFINRLNKEIILKLKDFKKIKTIDLVI